MNRYLKLYDERIAFRLDKKEKAILKKNAFAHKMTLSNYLWLLILIDNRNSVIQKKLKEISKNMSDRDFYCKLLRGNEE